MKSADTTTRTHQPPPQDASAEALVESVFGGQKVDEAKANQAANTSQNAVLDSLTRLRASGRVKWAEARCLAAAADAGEVVRACVHVRVVVLA